MIGGQPDAPGQQLGSPDSTGIVPGGLMDEPDDLNKYVGETDQVKSDKDGPSVKPTSLDVSDNPIDSEDDSTNDLPITTQPKTPEHRYPIVCGIG